MIKSSRRKVEYIIVNEAGASVYSASKLLIEEFPDLHVEERSGLVLEEDYKIHLLNLLKSILKVLGLVYINMM